jgi:hypothetical protein
MHLITELCDAFDNEREENRELRRGCVCGSTNRSFVVGDARDVLGSSALPVRLSGKRSTK